MNNHEDVIVLHHILFVRLEAEPRRKGADGLAVDGQSGTLE
jgi:hypothetical protein